MIVEFKPTVALGDIVREMTLGNLETLTHLLVVFVAHKSSVTVKAT